MGHISIKKNIFELANLKRGRLGRIKMLFKVLHRGNEGCLGPRDSEEDGPLSQGKTVHSVKVKWCTQPR